MNLHKHKGLVIAPTVVIFVHGLNGNGYNTWRNFPRYIFEGTDEVIDVALFDYFSGVRRRFRHKPQAEEIAETLAQRMAVLGRKYDEVYLVAHSLGGLISKDAAKIFIERYAKQPGSILSLAGVIHFGTPLRGSDLSRGPVRLLITEYRNLRPRSYYQTEIAQYFEENIDTRDSTGPLHVKYRLPIYAGYGEFDRVVKRISAVNGVHPEQRQSFRGGHGAIVKPLQQNSPQVEWTREVIRTISANRAEIRAHGLRVTQHPPEKRNFEKGFLVPPNHLVTEVQLDSGNPEWLQVYHQAVAGASTEVVKVKDVTHVPFECDPHLLISIHENNRILARRPDTEECIRAVRNRFDLGGVDVRILGVGSGEELARNLIELMSGEFASSSSRHRFFIDFVSDPNKLRDRIMTYIGVLVANLEERLSYSTEGHGSFSSIAISDGISEEYS